MLPRHPHTRDYPEALNYVAHLPHLSWMLMSHPCLCCLLRSFIYPPEEGKLNLWYFCLFLALQSLLGRDNKWSFLVLLITTPSNITFTLSLVPPAPGPSEWLFGWYWPSPYCARYRPTTWPGLNTSQLGVLLRGISDKTETALLLPIPCVLPIPRVLIHTFYSNRDQVSLRIYKSESIETYSITYGVCHKTKFRWTDVLPMCASGMVTIRHCGSYLLLCNIWPPNLSAEDNELLSLPRFNSSITSQKHFPTCF